MLYCILGESGSGKSTICKELLKNKDLELNDVVTCTTRPMRTGEVQGVDYDFVDAESAKILIPMSIEARRYRIITGEYWYYFTLKRCLSIESISHNNYICVTSPEQFGAYFKAFPGYVIPIVIKVTGKLRLLRSLEREDNPNCEEICRRYLSDVKQMRYLYANIDSAFIYYNDSDISNAIDKISKDILDSDKDNIYMNGKKILTKNLSNGFLFKSLLYDDNNRPISIIKDATMKGEINYE